MKTKILFTVITLIGINVTAQNVNNIKVSEITKKNQRQIINVPDILGFKTLKCDFHMHTVFSDGLVWPTFRVDEAWNEGLDAIAITDHIENNPSKKYVGGNDNSPYEIAIAQAKKRDIILIHAGEITREMPPGHFNALFINDVSALDTSDYMDAFRIANEQGGFVIWNHPGWQAQQPDTCKWWDIHTELLEEGWLHGIEVFNEQEWYPVALDWCINKDLTVTATSDIHGIISEQYDLEKFHRPLTLVLATERNAEAIHKAMVAGRTIAWFGNTLAGKEEFLKAFFEGAVKIENMEEKRTGKSYLLKNSSDVPFLLRSEGFNFTIPARGELIIKIPNDVVNKFIVENLYIRGTERLSLSLDL